MRNSSLPRPPATVGACSFLLSVFLVSRSSSSSASDSRRRLRLLFCSRQTRTAGFFPGGHISCFSAHFCLASTVLPHSARPRSFARRSPFRLDYRHFSFSFCPSFSLSSFSLKLVFCHSRRSSRSPSSPVVRPLFHRLTSPRNSFEFASPPSDLCPTFGERFVEAKPGRLPGSFPETEPALSTRRDLHSTRRARAAVRGRRGEKTNNRSQTGKHIGAVGSEVRRGMEGGRKWRG